MVRGLGTLGLPGRLLRLPQGADVLGWWARRRGDVKTVRCLLGLEKNGEVRWVRGFVEEDWAHVVCK